LRFAGWAAAFGLALGLICATAFWLSTAYAYAALFPLQAREAGFWQAVTMTDLAGSAKWVGLTALGYGVAGLVFGGMGEHRLRRSTRSALIIAGFGGLLALLIDSEQAIVGELQQTLSHSARMATAWFMVAMATMGAGIFSILGFLAMAASYTNDPPPQRDPVCRGRLLRRRSPSAGS
jgi:hypothetical protein